MNSSTTPTTQSSETVRLVVTEAIGDNLCIACDDGQKLYEQIAAALKESKKVILDFHNVEETIPAFMGTAIGQLYSNFPEEQIEKSLTVVNADSDAVDDIKNAVYWTKRYLEDPERFKAAAQEFLGDDDE